MEPFRNACVCTHPDAVCHLSLARLVESHWGEGLMSMECEGRQLTHQKQTPMSLELPWGWTCPCPKDKGGRPRSLSFVSCT